MQQRIINLSGKRLKDRPTLYGVVKFGVNLDKTQVIEPESLRFERGRMTDTYLQAIKDLNIQPQAGDIIIAPKILNSEKVAQSLWPQTTVIKFEYLT